MEQKERNPFNTKPSARTPTVSIFLGISTVTVGKDSLVSTYKRKLKFHKIEPVS